MGILKMAGDVVRGICSVGLMIDFPDSWDVKFVEQFRSLFSVDGSDSFDIDGVTDEGVVNPPYFVACVVSMWKWIQTKSLNHLHFNDSFGLIHDQAVVDKLQSQMSVVEELFNSWSSISLEEQKQKLFTVYQT